MAVLQGNLLSGPYGTTAGLWTTDDQTRVSYIVPPIVMRGTISNKYGTLTNNFPVDTTPRVIQGEILTTYYDYFFNRLRIIPETLALGNLLSTQTRNIEVWNASTQIITITSIDGLNLDGVVLIPPAGIGDPPFTVQPNRSLIYQVRIDVTGPPSLDATLVWHSTIGDASLHITGSRIVVFPFIPNWANGIEETLSSRSVLMRSPIGTEQAISLRKRFRRSYSISYTLHGLALQRFNNLMFGWQARLFGVPLWPERGEIKTQIVSGDTRVNMTTTGRTIVPGGLVMIYVGKDIDNYESREVLSVDATGFTVKTPLDNPWPVGARVVPVVQAASVAQVQFAQLTDSVASIGMQFNCEPSKTDPLTPNTPAPALYKGYELYIGKTNWRDGMSANYNSDVLTLDQQTNYFLLQPQSGYTGQGRTHDWFLKSLADVLAFRAWLYRRQGRTFGVWMPSQQNDFNLAKTVVSGTSDISVVTNGYVAFAAGDSAKSDIYIQMRDGRTVVGRITASIDNADNTTTLHIDTAITFTINPSDIRRFCFLQFYRLVADDTVIRWAKPGVAESTTGLLATRAII